MRLNEITIPCLLVCLVMAVTACSGTAQTTGPTPMVTSPPTQPPALPTPTNIPSLTVNPIHKLGQLVELNGLSMALVQVVYDSGQLQVMFAAKNTGADVLSPSQVSFSASTASGTTLKSDYCLETAADGQKKLSSASRFSGNLQPGEILKGTTCWDAAAPQPGNQLGYSPDFGKPPAALWDVSSPGTADVPGLLTANTFTTPPHAQGESVALKDITISLDKLDLAGGFINAYFTIKNGGSSTYKFDPPLAASHESSPLDDSFSYRLSDGSPMGSGNFMGTTCQNVSTSVVVLPGQAESLHLCFGNYDPIVNLASGALVSFYPSADQGGQVNWLTK